MDSTFRLPRLCSILLTLEIPYEVTNANLEMFVGRPLFNPLSMREPETFMRMEEYKPPSDESSNDSGTRYFRKIISWNELMADMSESSSSSQNQSYDISTLPIFVYAYFYKTIDGVVVWEVCPSRHLEVSTDSKSEMIDSPCPCVVVAVSDAWNKPLLSKVIPPSIYAHRSESHSSILQNLSSDSQAEVPSQTINHECDGFNSVDIVPISFPHVTDDEICLLFGICYEVSGPEERLFICGTLPELGGYNFTQENPFSTVEESHRAVEMVDCGYARWQCHIHTKHRDSSSLYRYCVINVLTGMVNFELCEARLLGSDCGLIIVKDEWASPQSTSVVRNINSSSLDCRMPSSDICCSRKLHKICTLSTRKFSNLPTDILLSVVIHSGMDAPFQLVKVDKFWNKFFDDDQVWYVLWKRFFGEFKFTCGCKGRHDEREKLSNLRPLHWRDGYFQSRATLCSFQRGKFKESLSYDYPIEHPASYMGCTSCLIHGRSILIERQVFYDGTTIFSFRDLKTGFLEFRWQIPLKDIFVEFHPLRNRIHCDLEVYRESIMILFYAPSLEVKSAYIADLPEQLAMLPEVFSPLKPWTPSSGSLKWIRFRPPMLAMDGVDFMLCNVRNIDSAPVYSCPSNRSVLSAAWDDDYIVTARIGGAFYISNFQNPHVVRIINGNFQPYGKYLGFLIENLDEHIESSSDDSTSDSNLPLSNVVINIFVAESASRLVKLSSISNKIEKLELPEESAAMSDHGRFTTFLPPQGLSLCGFTFFAWSSGRDVYLFNCDVGTFSSKHPPLVIPSHPINKSQAGVMRVVLSEMNIVTVWTDLVDARRYITWLAPIGRLK